MQNDIGAFTLLLLIGAVASRVFLMKKKGVDTMHFGKLDKTDFLIPPFVFFYFYTIFATAFGWPTLSRQELFQSEALAWVGAASCLAGLLLFAWSVISFGESFRVGIDTDQPDRLITTGAFAVTRNPIYVGFWFVLLVLCQS